MQEQFELKNELSPARETDTKRFLEEKNIFVFLVIFIFI